MSGRHALPDAAPPGDGIRFVTRGVDHVQAAAVIAVLDEFTAQTEAARRAPEPGPTAWALSARALRSPVVPGSGAWRSFSG